MARSVCIAAMFSVFCVALVLPKEAVANRAKIIQHGAEWILQGGKYIFRRCVDSKKCAAGGAGAAGVAAGGSLFTAPARAKKENRCKAYYYSPVKRVRFMACKGSGSTPEQARTRLQIGCFVNRYDMTGFVPRVFCRK